MSENQNTPQDHDVTAKVDETELTETEGTEAGGWTWTIPVATLTVCPSSACTQVC